MGSMAARKQQTSRASNSGFGYHNLNARMKDGIIGQDDAVDEICPFIEVYQSGLAPPRRPAAIVMMLGKTGVGKTQMVEQLAYCLHGNPSLMLRLDCGEYQSDHEVAKLIGAPPGYLGHRETVPVINQQKLNSNTSERCNLSIVLFDEIEKASPALVRILLGVLDKSRLKLGDNSEVNFDNTVIFMTSNLGAEELKKYTNPDFGYAAHVPVPATSNAKLSGIGSASAKRRLPPEFINRLDTIITFKDLTKEDIEDILDIELEKVGAHVKESMGARAFTVDVTPLARKWLIKEGFSKEYGARNLKRLINKHILYPAALKVNSGELGGGDVIRFSLKASSDGLDLTII